MSQKTADTFLIGLGLLSIFAGCAAASAQDIPFAAAPYSPPPLLHYKTSWIGNTFGDGTQWVQKDGQSLAVTPDGRCYVGASWDESRKAAGIYKNGACAGQLQHIDVTTGAMAVDDKYAFCGVFSNAKGPDGKSVLTFGVARYTLDGAPAPWAAGAAFRRDSGNNFLAIGPKWLAGAAAANGELSIGDPATDTVRVFDRDTMVEKRAFPAAQPFRLTVGGASLWVLHGAAFERGAPVKIDEYSLAGKPTGRSLPPEQVNGATAIALDAAGHLLVAGPRQQVLKFDIEGAPRLIGTLGQAGGVWGGTPGLMAPDKLLCPVGVGADAAGDIYVLDRAPAVGGGFDLREFSPDGKMPWQLVSTQFTDVADADPAGDGVDLYTRDEHFVMDYSKPAGQQWTWRGYTIDPQYDDGRLSGNMPDSMFEWSSPLVRRLAGRLYYFARPGQYIGIFRKGAGETFIPSGLIDLAPLWQKQATGGAHFYSWPPQQNKLARWIWRDKNGDGKITADEFENRPEMANEVDVVTGSWVDANGDIWMSGISAGHRCLWHLPLKGFDAQQNPIYNMEDFHHIDPPDEFRVGTTPNFHGVGRLVYDKDSDTMYLSGTTDQHPKEAHWGSIGTEILRYDDWSKPGRKVRWRIVPPVDAKNADLFFPAFTVAGNRLYAMQRFQAKIHVYDTANGNEIGLISPGPEVGKLSGWCDMDDGIQAFQRKNGDALVFAEDDYRERIILYQVPSR